MTTIAEDTPAERYTTLRHTLVQLRAWVVEKRDALMSSSVDIWTIIGHMQHLVKVLPKIEQYVGDTELEAYVKARHPNASGYDHDAHLGGIIAKMQQIRGLVHGAIPTGGAPDYWATEAVRINPNFTITLKLYAPADTIPLQARLGELMTLIKS